MQRGLHAPVIGLIISIKDILGYIEGASCSCNRINYFYKRYFRIY
jgi:hypothetical protein